MQTNDSQIVNDNGATWNGKILGNNNVVFNMVGSYWNGDVVANTGPNSLGQIDNLGAWTGNVVSNAWTSSTSRAAGTGNVLSNAGLILNNYNDPTNNPTGAQYAVWNGDATVTTGQIINDHGGVMERQGTRQQRRHLQRGVRQLGRRRGRQWRWRQHARAD